MNEQVQPVIDSTKELMDKALNHLASELNKIRAGKANTSMLDGLVVDYYGAPTPIGQAANISAPDARTLVIQPWDKSLIQPIERCIMESNLGLNPQNDGETVRLNIPPLTEERRKLLVKTVKSEGEQAKIAVRNIRKDANEKIKRLQKDGLAEDIAKDAEGRVQQLTDSHIAKIDEQVVVKEKEVMTV